MDGPLNGFLGNSHVYHPKVAVLLQLVQLGHTKHCAMYKFIYFGIFWRLKLEVQ